MYIEDNSFENNNRTNDLTYIYLYAQVSSLIILILHFTLLLTIGRYVNDFDFFNLKYCRIWWIGG